MNFRCAARILLGAMFFCLLAGRVHGFALEGPRWPVDSTIPMELELGPTNVALEDQTGTWDGSAANALSLWNTHLERVQFTWVSNSAELSTYTPDLTEELLSLARI